MFVLISFLVRMTFHNHLHEHTKDENESFFFRYAVAIGIVGMVLSFIGNVKQTNEMYPLFIYENSTEVRPSYRFLVIPASFVFSVCSDVCLIIYGIIMKDIVIIGYAALNTVVILFLMIQIHYDHNKEKMQNHPDLTCLNVIGS